MDWEQIYSLELVLARMMGCIIINPIFGRGAVPGIAKMGLAMALSIFAAGTLPTEMVLLPNTTLKFALRLMAELGVGFVLGFLMRLFFSAVQFGGEIIDTQMGMTMAQIYDSSSQMNLTVTGSLLNVLLILNFFAENGHYTLLRILVASGRLLPFGQVTFGEEIASYTVEVFLTCMVFAVKLAFPILAAELLSEIAMGILMKAIPQINAFVINIELKVIVGLALLLVFLTPMNEFLLEMEQEMLQSLEQSLGVLAG